MEEEEKKEETKKNSLNWEYIGIFVICYLIFKTADSIKETFDCGNIGVLIVGAGCLFLYWILLLVFRKKNKKNPNKS